MFLHTESRFLKPFCVNDSVLEQIVEYSGKDRHPAGTQKGFIQGRSAWRSDPLHFSFIHNFFTEREPLSYTFYYDNWYPFHISSLEHFIFFFLISAVNTLT